MLNHIDEGRPTCMRCEKAGYKCAGYARETIFRNQTAITTIGQRSGTAGLALVQRQAVGAAQQPPLCSELSLIAFKGDMQYAYLFDNFVWSTYANPWLWMAACGKLGQLSVTASQALAQSAFGKHHNHSETIATGAVSYSNTVKSLVAALAEPGNRGKEALLVPVLILLMHAVRTFLSTATHWIQAQMLTQGQSTNEDRQAGAYHINGLTNLLNVCGPAKFNSPLLARAFESSRSLLVSFAPSATLQPLIRVNHADFSFPLHETPLLPRHS